MNNLSFKLYPRKVVSNFNKLAADFPRATASAINKTATQAFNAGKKEIRDEYNIKAADLSKSFYLNRANQKSLYARIVGLGRALGLIKFGAKIVATGVQYKIKKRGSSKIFKHAFISTMESGHRGVYKRAEILTRWSRGRKHTSTPNLPIEEKYTIGVASMLRAKKIQTKIIDYFHNNFARIFKHEIEWFLSKK